MFIGLRFQNVLKIIFSAKSTVTPTWRTKYRSMSQLCMPFVRATVRVHHTVSEAPPLGSSIPHLKTDFMEKKPARLIPIGTFPWPLDMSKTANKRPDPTTVCGCSSLRSPYFRPKYFVETLLPLSLHVIIFFGFFLYFCSSILLSSYFFLLLLLPL